MPNTVKRLNYYDHQFLRAPDFSDEQNYHLSMRRLHNSSLHTWGIVQGLEVSLASGGTGTAVTVNSGVALDSTGREMVLATNTNPELGGAAANTTLYITITYDEQPSDPTTEAGGPGNTRVTEAPKLSFSKDAPGDNSLTLILAKVPRTGTGLGPVDASDRKQAGVVLGSDLTINTLTLKKDGVAQPNWPVLSCGAANQAAFANSGLSVGGSVGIGPTAPDRNLTISGATGAGVYANVKNANHEVLLGVDTTTILSAMTASDLQIRTNNTTRVVVQANTGNVQANGSVGVGTPASKAKLQVDGMVGNTVAMFGSSGTGMSLVASWPNIGFNCYYNGGWKAISPGWSGNIDVNQDSGTMNFYVNAAKANAADTALTPVARLSINSNGKLTSPMWKATSVMNQVQGALPKSAPFSSGGGTLVIIFSGSGRRDGGGSVGMNLQLDGAVVSTTRVWTNESASHKAFTTNIHVQANVAAGNHTITLAVIQDTITDVNDWFNVTVLELPF
jgi:hypothetical protein